MTTLVLLQNDLRLLDNPALYHGALKKSAMVVAYIKPANLGQGGQWWHLKSLEAFAKSLKPFGIPLIYWEEDGAKLVEKLKQSAPITSILQNQNLYEGVGVETFYPNLLYLHNAQKQYKIFTPFWRFVQMHEVFLKPLPKPLFEKHHAHDLPYGFSCPPRAEKMEGPLDIHALESFWSVGEEAALEKWGTFMADEIHNYEQARDIPSVHGTSRLSPHLRFGEVSVRYLWWSAQDLNASASRVRFLSELGWREYGYHLLHYYPQLRKEPMQDKFKQFPWVYNEEDLKRWQLGQTGIPLVDAGMRELLHCGWMHNRVRMITASFLCKNLRLPWQWGEKWFFECLVDGDEALNGMNWQWVAGCGTDAAPYFRVFNPTLQGEKFDPHGHYVRKWVPELKDIHGKAIHDPLKMGSSLFQNYPNPMVDLKESREKALAAYGWMKEQEF